MTAHPAIAWTVFVSLRERFLLFAMFKTLLSTAIATWSALGSHPLTGTSSPFARLSSHVRVH